MCVEHHLLALAWIGAHEQHAAAQSGDPSVPPAPSPPAGRRTRGRRSPSNPPPCFSISNDSGDQPERKIRPCHVGPRRRTWARPSSASPPGTGARGLMEAWFVLTLRAVTSELVSGPRILLAGKIQGISGIRAQMGPKSPILAVLFISCSFLS
jgi:hypothetical protein